jgi:hypothetical protein
MNDDRVTDLALTACRLLIRAYCGGLYRAGEFAGPVIGALDAAYVAAVGAIRAEDQAQRLDDDNVVDLAKWLKASSFHNS